MNSFMIILKTNMGTNQNCYLQILAAKRIKPKLKLFMTILVRIKNAWFFVIILLSYSAHYSLSPVH